MQKYSLNQHLIETLLAYVNAGEIAIPEIQRPFVWDASQVRDLLDSDYYLTLQGAQSASLPSGAAQPIRAEQSRCT